MQRFRPVLIGLLALFTVACADAQADESADRIKPAHGGQVATAGPLHLELLVQPKELTLYLNDREDGPVDITRGSAKAIITGGRNRYVVLLSPAGNNMLKGTGEYKLGAYNEIALMVALPDQELQHAKFVHPKGAKPPAKRARKGKGSKSSKKKPAQ